MTCPLCDNRGYLDTPQGRITCDLCHPPKPKPKAGTEAAYQESLKRQKPCSLRRVPRRRK